MRNAINLADKLALFDEQWAPKVIAEMNGYQLKPRGYRKAQRQIVAW